jgi:hypothetical protein
MLEIPASGEPGCGVGMRRWPWWSRPAESISSASSSGSVRQGRPENASELFPLVHTLFANMKTWINGTLHGVNKTWLPAYVQAFAYRLNRRSQSHDGVLWQFLLRRMGEGHVARLGDPRRGDGAAQGGVNAGRRMCQAESHSSPFMTSPAPIDTPPEWVVSGGSY